MRRHRLASAGIVFTIAVVFGACGGGSSSPTSPNPSPTSPNPSPTPPNPSPTPVTITSSGVSPKQLTVPLGTRVQFVNNDTTNPFHTMDSNPHPEHTDCPEINQVDFILPGQTKETGNFNTVRTCGYHDHEWFADTRWQGEIVVR